MTDPVLSIVVPVWDELDLTRRCVASLRAHTDVPYEVIGVDNGSRHETAAYVASSFDTAIRNDENRGFAPAMNQGLSRARGRSVVFLNNDTEVPPHWALPLLSHFASGAVGLVVPVVTAAGNYYSVRESPGSDARVVPPFSEIPSGVAYVMETAVARELGGWSEAYGLASSEDLDLLFTVWANGLSVVLDERVLITHASAASARRLPDREAMWRRNRAAFVDRWSAPDPAAIPRLERCPPERFAANLETAALAATWLGRWFAAKDALADAARAAATPAEPAPAATGAGWKERVRRALGRS